MDFKCSLMRLNSQVSHVHVYGFNMGILIAFICYPMAFTCSPMVITSNPIDFTPALIGYISFTRNPICSICDLIGFTWAFVWF